MDLQGKRILIAGLARTGLATARFLLKRGSDLVIVDDKPEAKLGVEIEQVRKFAEKDACPVKLCLGGTSPQRFDRLDLLVLSPGVPPTHPIVQAARAAAVPVISEIELAFRFLKGKIVAITGSNGKTTCTAMIGAILKRKYPKVRISGNIGEPLIGQVEGEDETTWHSVELSSFQLEAIDRFRPGVAVMLNLTPDHMDRYESMHAYAASKERIFENQSSEDIAVLNADDPLVAAMSKQVRARVRWFSRQKRLAGVHVHEGKVCAQIDGNQIDLLEVTDIPLRGAHNVENVLACVAAGLSAGVSAAQIAEAVRAFRSVEHRLEHVETIEGVAFFNDSKATNVDSAIKSLQSFTEPLLVILGGRDKGSDFSVMREAVQQHARQLILIGESTSKIERALGDAVSALRAGSMEEAVKIGFTQARPGEVVLLAPACASFDMFHDYEDRGRAFKEAVRKLRGTS
jgi:UDP-N-acetylmuramoylalanine--D-glutamate ligase